jgi:hypothetical protein
MIRRLMDRRCAEVRAQLSGHLEGLLPPQHERRVLRHLARCAPAAACATGAARRIASSGCAAASARESWLSRAVWPSYLRLALHGRPPRRREQDVRWLGADFVLGRDGAGFEHRSRHGADYASPRAIAAAVAAAGR